MPYAIGIDVGRSATKVVASDLDNPSNRKYISFPSLVLPAFKISDPAAMQAAANETEHVGGQSFFVGQTAKIQSGVSNQSQAGLYDNWIDSPQYQALIQSAFARLAKQGISASDSIVVHGLPSKLFAEQRQSLIDLSNRLIPGASDHLVLPQPAGVYYSIVLDNTGMPAASTPLNQQSWSIIDIGHFTTDFILMKNGSFVQLGSDSNVGFSFVIDRVKTALADRGTKFTFDEIQDAIESGTNSIRYFNRDLDIKAPLDQALDAWMTAIHDTSMKCVAPFAHQLNGVCIGGGPAYLVSDRFLTIWEHSKPTENPRFSVAEGFCRAAAAKHLTKLSA